MFNLWQKVKTQGVEKVKTQGVEKVPPNLWQNVRQRLHPFRPMKTNYALEDRWGQALAEICRMDDFRWKFLHVFVECYQNSSEVVSEFDFGQKIRANVLLAS